MGRMYRIVVEGVVVSQTDVGDLLVIQGAANIVSVVHGYRVTQREESLSQQLRLRVIRRSTAPLGAPATVTPARQFHATPAHTSRCSRDSLLPRTLGLRSARSTPTTSRFQTDGSPFPHLRRVR